MKQGLGPLNGSASAQKALQGSKAKMRELLVGLEENNILQIRVYVTDTYHSKIMS